MIQFVTLMILSCWVWSLELPRLTGPVVDRAQLLNSSQKSQLEEKIRNIYQMGGPQIQILTVKDLQGTSIEDFSIRVVEQWQLGDQKRDDGLLVMMSTKERKLRIEVGQGLEPFITDALSSQIINNLMIPHFKEQRYYEGFNQAIDVFQKVINQEELPREMRRHRSTKNHERHMGNFLLFFLFIPALISNLLPKKNKTLYSFLCSLLIGITISLILFSTLHFTMVLISTIFAFIFSLGGGGGSGGRGTGAFYPSRHGYYSSGGSFGGGWSGGGGGFSGGGASGSW